MFMLRRGRSYLERFGFPPGVQRNQPIEVLSRWQKPGDRTDVGRYSQDILSWLLQGTNLDYDEQYTSASYLRIKNISMGYNFKKALLRRMHLESLRFYLQGQNLFTFSPYKNLDPESTYFQKNLFVSRMPPLRTLTAGFQLTF